MQRVDARCGQRQLGRIAMRHGKAAGDVGTINIDDGRRALDDQLKCLRGHLRVHLTSESAEGQPVEVGCRAPGGSQDPIAIRPSSSRQWIGIPRCIAHRVVGTIG
ncbi:MAG: hypothetical protein ACYDH6_20035 [Acidimicrobiales bacterium]